MGEHVRPPADISPAEFFTRWVPVQVGRDEKRRQRLGDTKAVLEFELTGDGGGLYTVAIEKGEVRGFEGGAEEADLHVRVDVDTWRQLNSGEISAPEAVLRRRVHLRGNLLLAIRVHLILG